jgi:hypothetical protein
MIIVRAFYGLKSSGAANRLHEIGYKPTKGDPDVWIRPGVKSYGFKYYEMVLVYVDDIFCILDNPKTNLSQIQEDFKFKDDKMEPPDVYIGSNLEKKVFNGVKCWTMSSHKYVNAAVEKVEKKLASEDKRLPK